MKKTTSLKIKSLIIAKTVDDLQSMSAAAVKLNSHQPYVSKLINDLERTLGFKVFNRDNTGVTTTTVGRTFIKKIDAILDAYDDLYEFIDSYKSSSCGDVYIYGDNIALNFIASKISPCFGTLNKDISIKLIATLGEYLPDNDDEWDLIMSSTLPKDDSVIVREIAEIGYNCFGSPSVFDSTLDEPSNLDKLPCIIWNDNTPYTKKSNQWSFTINCEHVKINVKSKLSCNNMSSAIEMAINGLGVVYAPYYTVQEYIQTERLIPLFDYRFNYYQKIYLIYRRRESQPFVVNQVITHIVNYVQSELPLNC
ncbi:LysR substrate-binding domain-containing protein [Aeromonas sp. MdU4]|uniref:LysR substrate-binding domain-containing protein n=1 Tax=Aeromonas sp. MdU4 TaxID=3342819 RepID=UPI0035BAD341